MWINTRARNTSFAGRISRKGESFHLQMEIRPFDPAVELITRVTDVSNRMVRHFRKWTKVSLLADSVLLDRSDQDGKFKIIDTSLFVPWWLDPLQSPPEDVNVT